MPKLTISLFGRFRCEIDGISIVGVEGRKTQELLSYLALSRSRMHHRDVLCTTFWEDRSELQAKKGLRQVLWMLQSALNAGSNGTLQENLNVEGDWIGLNPQVNIWVDAVVLEQTYAQFQNVSGATLGATGAEQVRDATLLHKGDLLEGLYHDWCVRERERFQFMYLSLLDKLLGYYELTGDYENGVTYGMQSLNSDRARESTHRRLMRLHYIAGHRTRALHQYAACVVALREELGVEPAKSTQRLYQQICDDQMEENAHATDPRSAPLATTSPASSFDALGELLHLRHMIELLRQQVDSMITSIHQV